MDVDARYSRRLLLSIFVVFSLVFILANGALYLELPVLIEENFFPGTAQSEVGEAPDAAAPLIRSLKRIDLVMGACSAAVLIFFGLILWLWQRRLVTGLAISDVPLPRAPESSSQDVSGQVGDNAERLYLHLLSLFQQEGRLLDLLSEDLDDYVDEQIGAAVRSVHADCQRTLNKYLSPRTVIDAAEGEPYTVEPGFDPSLIKLIGNVTGKPPFTGVVRHQGWRAGRVELPTLSDAHGLHVLAPAEIEIIS